MSDIANLQLQNASLQERVSELEQENRLLRRKLDRFIRRFLGKKSEALDPAQLQLLLAGLLPAAVPPTPAQKAAAVAPTSVAARERQASRRHPLPEDVVTEQIVLEPPEVQRQPAAWKRIGEEVTTELDYTPGHFHPLFPRFPTDHGASPMAGRRRHGARCGWWARCWRCSTFTVKRNWGGGVGRPGR